MTYAELHCHSYYSFHEGSSSIPELLIKAKELEYPALALTDHNNLCGAMEFAEYAMSLDIKPITGAEITLIDGSHLTFLTKDLQGYNNLCKLVTNAYLSGNRQDPLLDPADIPKHSQGLILLTGCRKGSLSNLLTSGLNTEATALLKKYLDWFGTENVFVELQQNLVLGDVERNRKLAKLASQSGIDITATNNVHYHIPERHRLNDVLVSIGHNKSLEDSHLERRPNSHFYMKSPSAMNELFKSYPDAISNTIKIAEKCDFVLSKNLNYQFPDYPVPTGYSPQSYLEELCYRAAGRRYGNLTNQIKNRLHQEFDLIKHHNLAGFLLIYYDVIQLAREIMISMGLSDHEIPLEERPPGRGRGSSVSMLVGYLIGLSHIDPLEFNLSLDRFLPSEMASIPDIDLDFPRNIREQLIIKVHEKYGWDHAALTGMISTYKMKGAIRDIGRSLGIPKQDISKLAGRVASNHPKDIKSEMMVLPEFRDKLESPAWRNLINLAEQLDGFPKYLAQHPGGMIISSSPLTDLVPIQPAAINDRYICQWDKNSIASAGFVKIDFLALGTLSQMQEALQLIEKRTGDYHDLTRINHNDHAVYNMIHKADTIGVFQVESAAQMQTVTRILPKNLTEMAYEVAAVRPGVGANNGVSQFIRRHRKQETWDYDHYLERRSLERTLGVILFQDQVNQLAMDVAGFSSTEADLLRRAFVWRKDSSLLNLHWDKFKSGALSNGVSKDIAVKIFKKFNGQYMFPESHAFAFGVTAYHMAWLKYYYPLEFYVAIFNQQPMGFYNLETLKEDAKRHGISILNPDINYSVEKCSIKDESLLLGFMHVKGLGESTSSRIVKDRIQYGSYTTIAEIMQRTNLQREPLERLVMSGAFDSITTHRRKSLWEIGLRYRPQSSQLTLPISVEEDIPDLPLQSTWERMNGEYSTLGLYPKGHVMEFLRSHLPNYVMNSQSILDLPEGSLITTAGLVIRRQRPHAKAVFVTIEDELGHIPLVIWEGVYRNFRLLMQEPLIQIEGLVSRREGTFNIVVNKVSAIKLPGKTLPRSKDWQ